MGFFDDALGAMGQSLAQSASGYVQGVTGPVVGNMLGTLFAGQQTGGENLVQLQTALQTSQLTASQIDLLNGQMTAQTADIKQIGSQLTALSSAVAVLQNEVASMTGVLNKIAQEELFSEWQAVDLQMTDAITAINSDYTTLSGFVSNYLNTPVGEVSGVINSLQTNGPLESINLINALIMAGGQSRGVLQLWSAMVAPLVQTGLIDYRDAVDQYTSYYKKLVGAQLLAANILVEIANYYSINSSHAAAESAWNTYKTCILAQEDQFIEWLVPLVYSGVMAYAAIPNDGGPAYTFFEGAMQLHPGLQAMPGDSGGLGYYAPTSIFEEAEAMLSTLSITDPGQRRIVVHMMFSDDQQGTFKTPIDATPLTLTDGSGNVVSATVISKFAYQAFQGPPGGDPASTPDWYYFNGGYMYLYRHVYSQDVTNPTALPDGPYRLSNLNKELPPLETYFSQYSGSMTNFQETKILNYNLSISATSQCDFMNFAAYMAAQVGSPDI